MVSKHWLRPVSRPSTCAKWDLLSRTECRGEMMRLELEMHERLYSSFIFPLDMSSWIWWWLTIFPCCSFSSSLHLTVHRVEPAEERENNIVRLRLCDRKSLWIGKLINLISVSPQVSCACVQLVAALILLSHVTVEFIEELLIYSEFRWEMFELSHTTVADCLRNVDSLGR